MQTVSRFLNIVLLIGVVVLSFSHQVLPSLNTKISFLNVAAARPATNLTLQFSTFLGGSDPDHGRSISTTEEGNCYVTGLTESTDFPTKNAFDSSLGGDLDAFVSKFAADGSLLWSTFLVGSNWDRGSAITATSEGSCYVMGTTNSSDFPLQNAYNSTFSGFEDIFLAKFSANGLLLWSTYLGGKNMDFASDIAVTNDGSCYVTGETLSSDFPTKNAYDSTFNDGFIDAFVAKFSVNGTLLWSTYLGGIGIDGGFDIAILNEGSCYVTGYTASTDFPTQNAFDSIHNGDLDIFVTKFDTSGSLLWSSFIGGIGWDEAYGIAAASDGSCYVTGYTGSIDFPTLNAYSNIYDNWGDAFVVKFDSDGTLLWSTFLGGNGIDRGYDIAVSIDGSCYLVGETSSTNFPTMKAYDASKNDGFDVFVTKLSSDGFLFWSTYLGGSRSDRGFGIAVSEEGSCYVTGITYSDDFPTQNAFDKTYVAKSNGFVTKFIEPFQPATFSKYFYGFLGFMVVVLVLVIFLYLKRK